MALIKIQRDSISIAINSEIKWRKSESISFNTLKVTDPNTLSNPDNGKETSVGLQKPKDVIKDICYSEDAKFFAALTSGKKLFIYNAEDMKFLYYHVLPRAASKVRFSADSKYTLVADKTGDAFVYETGNAADPGRKIVGHLSLLLDILMSADNKYVISCDRDEKIKVSRFPGSYNIESFCMAHKEFVTAMEFLPHNHNYLISASGDGTVKIWEYVLGKLLHSVDVNFHFDSTDLLQSFQDVMKKDDVDVACLPITHMAVCKGHGSSSMLAVLLYLVKGVTIYRVTGSGGDLKCEITHRISLEDEPTSLAFGNGKLFICIKHNSGFKLQQYILKDSGDFICSSSEDITCVDANGSESLEGEDLKSEGILVLYKRKFDNVQEYQERKRQRLEGRVK